MKNQNIRNSYQNEIESYLINYHDQHSNNQHLWNKITKMLKQAAENTIGYVNKYQKSINEHVKELLLLQRSIKIQIESCINEENRTFYKIYQNSTLTGIYFIFKKEENEKIKQTTAELENMQNDNIKMYEVVKKIKSLRSPQKLLIKGKNSLTANPKEQSKIIAEYFKETFYKNKHPGTMIPVTRMMILFTANEIQKAMAKMKPNKSLGCNKIPVELIKYAPDRVRKQIAKIYNNMAETGDIPKEVTHGTLKPLQKPNKQKVCRRI